MIVQQIEREQWMSQVVQHAHEKHDVKPLSQGGNVVDGQLAKLDVDAGDFRGEPRLGEVPAVGVDADHAVGVAALHLDRVEAGVAADIENGLAAKVPGYGVRKPAPFDRRIVAEEM